jgi:putative protein-disulfide isomerase
MQPVIYYCYDAYCGWCYGFSPVIKKIEAEFKHLLSFEVLSGGMIPSENARPISTMAGYIAEAHKRVEELSGVKFGEDFLWHIYHPQESDWVFHSEKSAIALCIVKELFPLQQVSFASDLQYSLNYEGRDLTDDEAYRHLLVKYKLDADDFFQKLNSEDYKEKALYEFSLCRQLQVTGFPAVLLQTAETKFYLVARGYTSFEDVSTRLKNILAEIGSS